MTPQTPDVRSERGLLTTEFAILLPVVVIIGLAAILMTQFVRQESRAQSAADAAARAASFYVDDQATGRAAAESAARVECPGVNNIQVNYTPPNVDPLSTTFTPGRVVATLVCTESYASWSAIRSGGDRDVPARSVSVLEYWRPTP